MTNPWRASPDVNDLVLGGGPPAREDLFTQQTAGSDPMRVTQQMIAMLRPTPGH